MKNTTTTRSIQFSNHCLSRISQRGIPEEAIMQVILYGEIIHKQGLKFHYLSKSKCKKLEIDEDMVRDLMVITNSTRTEIVTCYKHPKAVHEVKKKSKRLARSPKYKNHNAFILNQQVA